MKCTNSQPRECDIATHKNDAAKAAFVLLKKVEKKKPNMTSTFENINMNTIH